MYKVIDRQTGKLMGTYKTRTTARRKAEKLDQVYGGIRYLVMDI